MCNLQTGVVLRNHMNGFVPSCTKNLMQRVLSLGFAKKVYYVKKQLYNLKNNIKSDKVTLNNFKKNLLFIKKTIRKI